MRRVYLLSILITLLSFLQGNSQSIVDSMKTIRGVLLDTDTQMPLPYANIHIKNTNIGTVSNEKGYFSIHITDLDINDTLCFQYIGYTTKCVQLNTIDSSTIFYLKEEIFNLNETLIFGSPPNPLTIVKNVIKYKDSNYVKTNSRKQIFIRQRDISDIDKIILKYKKSTISDLDRDLVELVERSIPRHSTSYTDFLGNVYSSKNEEDSIKMKIEPIRTVSLKEKDIAELEQLETIFKDVFTSVEENEYWKVKSGIFSQKIDMDDENTKSDTVTKSVKDTINENQRKLKYFQMRVAYQLKYSLLNDKREWEFLYNTGRYNYTLAGGTRVNGEDVYIIDFVPKNGGEFVGRMYISRETFALIRADYNYAEGKTGRDFQLLGIGYTENTFSGSIYFEKKDDKYRLKYFSKKAGSYATIDRDIALLKKRERFLFDKKLNEIKVGVDMALISESSIEMLILDEEEIPHERFISFEQDKFMDIIYVDQFDDNLWKGFSIIEPTHQMKEYKKQVVDFSH
ncbi:MAG: carboxypeptidase-like regulatory domain-containing protein [Bacteroidetes bacterium]|nr:carboxypeptidase-like regulatory domain-containing protein [Bacteroidota bacterium]